MKLIFSNAEKKLNELAIKAEEIKVLIAFLTEDGINWLPKLKYEVSSFIVGINMNITSSDCIRKLVDGGSNVNIYHDKGRMFHPKAIYFKTKDEEFLFIGSHNLTGKAMNHNYELSTLNYRNDFTDTAFLDFLSQFKYLHESNNCFQPSEDFYNNYKTQKPNNKLFLTTFDFDNFNKTHKSISYPQKLSTLGEYLKILSLEFPKLNRKRGKNIKENKLKIFNDQEFRPFFQKLIQEKSYNDLETTSDLNIGGNWYKIPNIFIAHKTREPWDSTYENGRLVVQIHFSKGYKEVSFSLVIQYNLSGKEKQGDLPLKVQERYNRVSNFFSNSEYTQPHNPQFLHWIYDSNNNVLWAKPILSVSYEVNNLPTDDILYKDLIGIINAFEVAIGIE